MPDAGLMLPLDPEPAFLGWLHQRHNLTPRQLSVLCCRVGQLTLKEAANALGLTRSYVQRVQARMLAKIDRPGGHTSLMRWTAEQYREWFKTPGSGAVHPAARQNRIRHRRGPG